MVPEPPPHRPPLGIPDPDTIRAEIEATDERARLLRRLLRLALRLHVHLATADRIAAPAAGKGAGRA
ncbi:MAG: hypothetical protein C0501_07940 [Isosphaera sp.]|nr:hypothetical protein [Isosphaera sp.]